MQFTKFSTLGRLGAAATAFAAPAVAFAQGESVRTDTSHKYDPATFAELATRSGWQLEETWIDTFGFALYLLRAD